MFFVQKLANGVIVSPGPIVVMVDGLAATVATAAILHAFTWIIICRRGQFDFFYLDAR